MKIRLGRINGFLALACLLLGVSCRTEDKKGWSDYTLLRLHLETNPDSTDRSAPVAVFRAKPLMVNVEKQPFIDERLVTKATVLDLLDSYALQIEFNRQGTLLLDTASTSYRGHRVAVFVGFKEKRWLAAPVLTQRITNGVFAFTPDATREETEEIANGLNTTARKLNNAKKEK